MKSTDFSNAIIEAFTKANEINKMFKLCLIWNRFDIAKNLLADKNKAEINFDENMLIALKKNRCEFVNLFLEENLSIRNFLNDQRLLNLYEEVLLKTYLLHKNCFILDNNEYSEDSSRFISCQVNS
jgi:hypothetical protein